MIREIEHTILAAVADVQEPAVPAFGQRQLHMKTNARIDEPWK